MPEASYIAWRTGRSGFSRWHSTIDNRYTRCGKKPDGLLSVWKGKHAPPVETCCGTCRIREARESHQGAH